MEGRLASDVRILDLTAEARRVHRQVLTSQAVLWGIAAFLGGVAVAFLFTGLGLFSYVLAAGFLGLAGFAVALSSTLRAKPALRAIQLSSDLLGSGLRMGSNSCNGGTTLASA